MHIMRLHYMNLLMQQGMKKIEQGNERTFWNSGICIRRARCRNDLLFLSTDLQVEQTQEHIDNHKAYVQSWIQMIEDKPENLVKAIAQAEKASQYMDEMAEREKDKVIEKAEERTMEVDESCIESKIR